jgi:hypothetical protein
MTSHNTVNSKAITAAIRIITLPALLFAGGFDLEGDRNVSMAGLLIMLRTKSMKDKSTVAAPAAMNAYANV